LILKAASRLYGTAAAWRRHWYARHPSRRHQLRHPVVSVGNLSVGGSGKTPIVAHLARLLTGQGERPCILSRGYGRRDASDAVTIVSDGRSVLADLDSSGDEPMMLARALPSVPVIVGPDRYRLGRFAEEQLGVTVHLLDDGFQHVKLDRDVDLLAVEEDDLQDLPLPAGRLREPLAMAAQAHAALVTAGYDEAATRIGRALGVPAVFRVIRTCGVPRLIATGETVVVPSGDPVFAVAAIARPERFVSDLMSAGWRVAGVMTFPDHHPFTGREVERVLTAARAARAAIVMTTDKDAVRLAVHDLGGAPVAAVPLIVNIEPATEFTAWLRDRLQAARFERESAALRTAHDPAPGTGSAPGTQPGTSSAPGSAPGTRPSAPGTAPGTPHSTRPPAPGTPHR
jgi:tetraacyldisaccharide 4'-kinase